MAETAGSSKLPAIADSSPLRFSIIFILYVAQGLPIGIFFYALPVWLAANGATAGEVGTFAFATSLPWTLKFFNGFFMDRYAYLPMGRRRAWLIAAQIAIVAGLVAMAVASPSHSDILLLSTLSFIVMTATTFQDVAIDGMAVDLVPDAERARANGFMFGGQAIGTAVGAAYTGFVIAAINLSAAALSVAFMVAIILVTIGVIRERPGERLMPWSPGQASDHAKRLHVGDWWKILKAVWVAMLNATSLKLILAQLSLGYCFGMYLAGMPLLATNVAGWTAEDFSGVSGVANLVAGIMGMAVFGIFADRVGPRNAALSLFGVHILLAALMLSFQNLWASDVLISYGPSIYLSIRIGCTTALCAIAMRICDAKVSATQFTLYMALANLGITLASSTVGPLDALGGYSAMIVAFGVAAVTGLVATMSIKQ